MRMRVSKNNLAGFLCGDVVYLTVCTPMGSNDVEEVAKNRPVVSSMVPSPDVPSLVPFCGRLVDIIRYGMREAYDRELSSLTYFRPMMIPLTRWVNHCFPAVEPVLEVNSIPDDFKYLAMIESYLDPHAFSPACTAGIWQLLEDTTREYGLTITSTANKRYHAEKTTGAACHYLKAAYKKYGDWMVVAVSYNDDMGCMLNRLVKQDADSSFNLWLVKEATRYIYRIMTIK